MSIITDFLPLFEKIEMCSADEQIIIVIDGGSASGKTTLSKMLSEKYDCNVFHTDDFFLQPEQRTAERFNEIGGNLDRERFQAEIVEALENNKPITYRRFNCSTQTLEESITVMPKRITVVEGAYSMHTAFGKYYHLAVFLDIEPEYQRERVLIRNSVELSKRFFNEWIPLENRYFEGMNVKERADIIFNISKK